MLWMFLPNRRSKQMKSHPVKVLILEEDDSSFAILHDVLSRDKKHPFLLERACNSLQGLQALQKGGYDACVLNCNELAMEFLHELAISGYAPPITILTGIPLNPSREDSAEAEGKKQPLLLQRAIRATIAQVEELERTQRTELRFWVNFLEGAVPIVLLDAEGRIISGNTAFMKMFGYSQEEMANLRLKNIVCPEHFPETERLFSRLFGGRNIQYQVENVCVRRDGSRLYVRHTALGLLDPEKSESAFALVAFEDAGSFGEIPGSEKELDMLKGVFSRLFDTHESERKLIAQELHDGLGAFLAAIKYSLERNLDQLQKRKGKAEVSLEEVIPLVQSAIEETRRISKSLWPSVLDDLGIVASITSFCSEFQKAYSSIAMEQKINVLEQEIPPSLKMVIYRILQEALNNVAKHSGANQVTLSLERKDKGIELFIGDNGQGFDYDAASQDALAGMGISSMKNRAELSGGFFSLQTRSGEGTEVRVVWPRQ
jgi:PAS domain S-box-containing protein